VHIEIEYGRKQRTRSIVRRLATVQERRREVQRYSVAWLSIGMLLMMGSGCRKAASDAVDVRMDLTIDPSPPAVGDANVSLQLKDSSGTPLEGAEVRVEGDMNHAGMKPSFADLRESDPGRYTGTLKFTMGGDWFLLVQAKTPDGKTAERKIDVRGVKSP
jgi:hypothetical protein